MRDFASLSPDAITKSVKDETIDKTLMTKEVKKVSPIFENKLWLWAVMGVIILLLGWFTFKMIRTIESGN